VAARPEQHLRVGAFARRVGLTAKALRHDDRIGLLRPSLVDADGFRWYAPHQLAIGRRIADVLAIQRHRLDTRPARVQRQLHHLTHLQTDGLEHPMPDTRTDRTDRTDERKLGAALFNATWTLLEKEERTVAEDDEMLHMAHASRHHWSRAPEHTPANLGRGEWQCARVYAVLGRSEPCLHHAQRYLEICRENGIADWDLAFAYEALARGHAVAGDAEQARAYTEQALAAAEDIATDEDRELLLSDLESIPGQPRFW
jgi:DNA-binding transcriptional MerR regulator